MKFTEIITAKVGKIWNTFTTSRGTVVITLDPDYTKEEAEVAVNEVKTILKEAKIKATVSYYWSHVGDRPMKVTIKITAKEIMKEEETMKSITLNLAEGIVKFELNNITYTYNTESKRYAKTENGKTKRIGKAEYEAAKEQYDLESKMAELDDAAEDDNVTLEQFVEKMTDSETEQTELDKDPCRVEVENDLYKPAVLNDWGGVDCSKCNVEHCVHRDCMRRNPRNVGGLGECPRLDAKVEEDKDVDPELEQIMDETGLEASDAELERNIRNEQKKLDKAMEKLGYHRIDSEWDDIRYATDTHEVMAWNTTEEGLKWVKGQTKKSSKPRRSKDIAYEGNGVTLTAKQVDFIRHLSDTCFWERGVKSEIWVDVLCDEIGGQFAGKPMTVGAMISTLCEKGLAGRAKGKVNKRTATSMGLTELGQRVAVELGLE